MQQIRKEFELGEELGSFRMLNPDIFKVFKKDGKYIAVTEIGNRFYEIDEFELRNNFLTLDSIKSLKEIIVEKDVSIEVVDSSDPEDKEEPEIEEDEEPEIEDMEELTPELAKKLRDEDGLTATQIGKMYGTSSSKVGKMIKQAK